MKKLYMILALLAAIAGGARAQILVFLPQINEIKATATGNPWITLNDYASIVSVPYEGLTGAYTEQAIMDELNMWLATSPDMNIRCVRISGLNASDPAASKGLIYFEIEYIGNSYYPIWINFYVCPILLPAEGHIECHFEMDNPICTLGLEYSRTWDNILLDITCPKLPAGYVLCKIDYSAPNCMAWPTVANLSTNIPLDPLAIPAHTVTLPGSLASGDYVVLYKSGGTAYAVSNTITIDEHSHPKYEWLDRPGETSPERVYNLDKNGQIHTMTTYVPLGTDTESLGRVLEDPRYTSNDLSFRLTDVVERANDIELTFEVSCTSNTGTSARTFSTGLSDRMLPGIPNKFVQPGGGKISVVLGNNSITVRKPKQGGVYALINAYTGATVQTVTGSPYQSDITFSNLNGMYHILENGVQVTKRITIASGSYFLSRQHIFSEQSVIGITSEDDFVREVVFRKVDGVDFNALAAEEGAELASWEEEFVYNSPLRYEYVSMTDSTCTFRVAVNYRWPDWPENPLSEQIESGHFKDTNGNPLRFLATGNMEFETYDVRGVWNNSSHTSFDITMSGSQENVFYTLFMEYGPFSGSAAPYSIMMGTGGPIAFENITDKGIFRVYITAPDGLIGIGDLVHMYDYSGNTNWTRTKVYRGGGAYNESVVHYDGLGRPVQQIAIGAGSNGNDIVQMIVYDNMGRNDAKTYFPFTRPSHGGDMSVDGVIEHNYYHSTKFPEGTDKNYAYSQKVYDGTTVTAYGPGASGNDHPVQQELYLNAGTEGVMKYVMADNGTSVKNSGPYPAGKLSVQKVKQLDLPPDQQSETYTYTNSAGQVVAEETRAGTDRRITYYVYDDMGRQRYVVPPIQSALLSGASGTVTPLSELRKYCFYNEYDDHGRITVQYVPGAEPTYTLYDRRGRAAMTQNGRLDSLNQWAFTKYDALDRPVMTGVVSGGTYASHKSALDNQTVFGETRGGTLHGYTNNTYPSAGTNDVLTVAYYDDYDWLNGTTGYGFSTSSDISVGTQNTTGIVGLQTGTKAKVLGITGHQWLTSVTYYDSKYQAIQSIADLYPSGRETVWNRHNFTGDVIQTKVRQTVGSQTNGYMKWFNFDNKGRLTNIQQKMDGDAVTVTIAAYAYDDMGAVVEKKIHNRETTSYSYDITGRQTGVTSPSFSYSLWFDKVPSGMTGARHDGNLAHVTWGGAAADEKGYTFTYDKFGQMTLAKYRQASGSSWASTDKFAERGITGPNEPIVYDKNGNIRSLYRTDANGGQLHKLEYNYIGNQLTSIKVNNDLSAAFAYDANGNMTRDGHTGVNITYNILDLPEKVFANNAEVKYIYDATGAKLATVAANGSLTYYRSVFTYAAASSSAPEQLMHVLHPEGLVQREGSAWVYKYFKTDHVGSTRAVLAMRGTRIDVDQRTDFYPYGLAHGSFQNLQHNKYLYGGKEYQDQMLGSAVLGLYDFHARYYNPMYGRWFNIDPALQTTNPYLYCGNSPMMYVDPSGEIFWAPIIFAAFSAGSMNLTMNAHNVDNFWQGLGYFGIGAAAGAAGGLAGAGVAAILPATGFLSGAATGAVAGFSSGFATGAGNSWMGGANFSAGLRNGLNSGGMGALSGGITGGIAGGLSSVRMGGNFFTGKGAVMRVDHTDWVTNKENHPKIDRRLRYTNEYAERFSDQHFPGYRRRLSNLYSDGTIPDGYTKKDGWVFNRKGKITNGVLEYYFDTKISNMYLFESAFSSPMKLQLVMGHEYVHLNLFSAGFRNIDDHEVTAYTWSTWQDFEYNGANFSSSYITARQPHIDNGGKFLGRPYFPPMITRPFKGTIFPYIPQYRLPQY